MSLSKEKKQRFMHRSAQLFYALLPLFLAFTTSAQTPNDTLKTKELPRFYRQYDNMPSYWEVEKTIGLSPRIGYDQDWFIGLAIQKGKLSVGHWGGNAQVWGAGYDYYLFDQSMQFHAGGFLHSFSFLGGVQLGAYAIGYQHKSDPWHLGFRPEIGLGLYKGYLNYGRNIYIDKSDLYRPKNSITLSFYITTYPFR